MKITIDVPDEIADRVIDGFAKFHNYQPKIDAPSNGSGADAVGTQIDNPQTKIAFVEERLTQILESQVAEQETREARETAEATAREASSKLITKAREGKLSTTNGKVKK